MVRELITQKGAPTIEHCLSLHQLACIGRDLQLKLRNLTLHGSTNHKINAHRGRQRTGEDRGRQKTGEDKEQEQEQEPHAVSSLQTSPVASTVEVTSNYNRCSTPLL